MSLYENIHKKRKSGRKMRAKGAKGAPTQQNFKDAARTARIKKGGKVKKK
jgi:signal recognition particle subunit SEC65